jgi:hypothetical protein
MDQKETKNSEVPVSELYHSSETQEHEFAGEFVAISEVMEGILRKLLSLNGTLLRKHKAQQMERQMEEVWRPMANPSTITDWRG